MLGNYSRWEFHHPGPAVFYLLGAGEYVFRDWLRIVPTAVNAQLAMLVLLNTALLFGAIEIWAGHCAEAIFRPLAWSGAVLVIFAVNHTAAQSAMVSLWMPHVALFPFLFFFTACASVAAGRLRHLPLVALGGMLLVHLHVAQVLFAGVMGLAGCVTAAVRLRGALRPHVWRMALSAGIVALFLLPMVVELVVHHPNNLDAVRAYLARYPNPSNGTAKAFGYLASFLTFSAKPESGEFTAGLSQGYVRAYWLLVLVGLVLVVRGRWPRFLRVAFGGIALVMTLFLYWANRITGPLYNFNGYFFYAVHLVLVFAIAAAISGRVKAWGRAAWILPCLAMGLAADSFRMQGMGSLVIPGISEGLRGAGAVQLVFRHDDWVTAIGVANQLARRGQPFCVDTTWRYMFGYDSGCGAGSWKKVVITGTGWHEQGRYPLQLPAVMESTEEVGARREGFYAVEGDNCWSGREASLTFTLAGSQALGYRVTLTGSVLPERPVEVGLNGHRAAVVDNLWKSSTSFGVAAGVVKAGEVNQMTFRTPGAAPISGDGRELGFSLISVRIEAAQ
jgi:hypothetical protein